MKTKAFTLVELMVVIVIIGLLIIWSNSLNFNKTKDKWELDLLRNNIVSRVESIRNSAMMWKWIWVNLDHPKAWKITFSNLNEIMKVEYLSWTDWQNDTENTVNQDTFWYKWISNIKCLKIDWTEITWLNNVSSWALLIEWDKLSLTWWCNNDLSKKLQMNFKYKTEISTWTINVVNWLIEY